MRRDLVAAALAVVGLVSASAAFDVKETTRITIHGGALASAIEIIEPSLLAQSNVYRGGFIGELSAAPDESWPRYTVTFDVQTLNGVKKAAYVVYYSVGPGSNRGFVYLPGAGDAYYRRNISTILREGHDGRWHAASPGWSAGIDAYLR